MEVSFPNEDIGSDKANTDNRRRRSSPAHYRHNTAFELRPKRRSRQQLPQRGGYELEVLAGKKRELPIYSVERSDKKIALTVDAAWEADKTDFILDTLDKYNIHATFFLCGFWADKYPEKVKAIAARGNEVGNHSSTHPHMNQLSAADIRKELEKYDDTIEKLLGYRTKAFRCPYGEYNDNVITTVRDMGYEVWQWDIDTIDWKEERSAPDHIGYRHPQASPRLRNTLP